MHLPGFALLLVSAPALMAQSWTTFYSAYEDGLTAQKQGDHALAARAFTRAIALEPLPGARVKTYGLNFLASYHPYLRLAESALALGDLSQAESALKDSTRLGKEPASEREALLARLRQTRQATVKPALPPSLPSKPQPTPAGPAPVQTAPAPAPAPVQAPAAQPPPSRPENARAPAVPAREKAPLTPQVVPEPVHPPAAAPPVAETPQATPAPLPTAGPAPVKPTPSPRWPLWMGLGTAFAVLAGLLLRRSRRAAGDPNPHHLDWKQLEEATVAIPDHRKEEDPNVHRTFGPYLTHRVLGRGGCATAYFATHRDTGEEVAIKIPHLHIARDEEFRTRFRREAGLGALLEHPRIVRIVDPGPKEGDPWLAMHFVRGTTLEAHLQTHAPLPIPQALLIASDVAEAIAYAHTKGVVHRDLKPANIMIGREGAVVMDFGIARILDTSMTSTAVFIGTPAYSAPESIVNPRVGPPADRYALGVIVFEMLAGHPPFRGDTSFQILEAQRNQPLPDLLALRPDTPPRLLRLVQRLCAKHPEDRPEDGETIAILAGLKAQFPAEA
jgi:hypothetical protein